MTSIQSGYVCHSPIQLPENQSLFALTQWCSGQKEAIEDSLQCKNCCVATQQLVRHIFKGGLTSNGPSATYFPLIRGSGLDANVPLEKRKGSVELCSLEDGGRLFFSGAIIQDPKTLFCFTAPCDFKEGRICHLSTENLQQLFQAVSHDPLNFWEFGDEGCPQRAILATTRLLSYGIDPGLLSYVVFFPDHERKIGYFSTTGTAVTWVYHYAVAVKDAQGKLNIFDPAVESAGPLTDLQWINKITLTPLDGSSCAVTHLSERSLALSEEEEIVLNLPFSSSFFLSMPITQGFTKFSERDQCIVRIRKINERDVLSAVDLMTHVKAHATCSNLSGAFDVVTHDLTEEFKMRFYFGGMAPCSAHQIKVRYFIQKLIFSVQNNLPLVTPSDFLELMPVYFVNTQDCALEEVLRYLGAYATFIIAAENLPFAMQELLVSLQNFYEKLEAFLGIDVECTRLIMLQKNLALTGELLLWQRNIRNTPDCMYLKGSNISRIQRRLTQLIEERLALEAEPLESPGGSPALNSPFTL